VQLWIENAMTEEARREKGVYPPNTDLVSLYAFDMYVFDNLINNVDRNLGNILYDADWQIWLIDHTRAFSQSKKLPQKERLYKCSSALWWNLQSLDDETAQATLAPYMGKQEISALLTRKKKITKHIREKIRMEGEGNVIFHYDNP